MRVDQAKRPWLKITVLTVLLLVTQIAVLLIVRWYGAGDDLLPYLKLILLVYGAILLTYLILYMWIDKLAPSSITYTVSLNGIMSLLMIMHAVAYSYVHVTTDWLAYNEGRAELSFLAAFIISDFSFYLVYVVFLFIHLILRLRARQ